MISENILNKVITFFRKEYFDPDVLRALLVTAGLVVPLVVSHFLGIPTYGSFAAITAQLLLATKIQTTYSNKASILVGSLILISIAPLIGTIVSNYLWWAVMAMALVAGISSLAKELGTHGQTLGLCAVIVFLLSLNGPHDIDTGLYRMAATWFGGMWASFIILFFWPIRPNLPYYTTLALPWELSGNLAGWFAVLSDTPDFEEKIQKKEINLRNAINNVLPFLRKKDQRFFYIRRDLLKVVRASSRFGATILAMYPNLKKVRQENNVSGIWLDNLQLCFTNASQAAKAVANVLVIGRDKDLKQLDKAIFQVQYAVNQLQQHLDSDASAASPITFDLHRIGILFQSAIHYLQDAYLLLNRIAEKKRQNLKNPYFSPYQPLSKLIPIRIFFNFKRVPLKHTFRLMLLTAISIALFYGFNIPRGYWIALTIMVVLQPDYGTTQQKALQRVTGTTIGAALSTILLIKPLSPGLYIFLIALFCFLFIYLQQRNYTVSVVFVTIMLVAMFEISGAIDWHYAAYRLFATSLGGIMAIVGAFLLWPDWERSQVRSILAKGILANRDLLVQLQHELVAQTGFHARIIADRRKAEVANLAISDSVVRLKLEPGTNKHKLEIVQGISFQNNRLTRELTALAALLPSFKLNDSTLEIISFLEKYTNQLIILAEYLKTEMLLTNEDYVGIPFPEIKTMLQPSAAHEISDLKNKLHIDAGTLKTELIHEQINIIADALLHLRKQVQALNGLRNI